MAVNSTATRELDIGRLIQLAYQRAGLLSLGQEVNPENQLFGADSLEIITDALVTEGIFVRNVDFYELTTVAGTATYTLPAYMLDLIDTAMYLPNGATTGETSIQKINRDRWVRIGNKDAAGRPGLYYPHRKAAPLEVRLWPIPDEAGTITFQYHSLSGDANDTTKTPDSGRHWNDYYVWRMAHDMALAAGFEVSRVGYFWKRAQHALEKAKHYSNELFVEQMVHAHTSGHTGGR